MVETQTDSTTADFDLGTKSQSSGNREIITVSDVVAGAANAPPANCLQLENLFSDKYNVADADALTAKWVEGSVFPPTGTQTANIDMTVNDALYVAVGSPTAVGNRSLEPPIKLTGNFSFQNIIDVTTAPMINGEYYILYTYQDANNYMYIARRFAGASDGILFYRVIGGVATSDLLENPDKTVSLRLRRDGTTLYGGYDLAQGESFTEWTVPGGFSGDVIVINRCVGVTTNGLRTAFKRNFKISSGAFVGGVGWRTSGNFIGRTFDTLSTDMKITAGQLHVNCPDANNTLKNGVNDAFEFYENTVNDFATATKLDGWTNAELLSAGMTEDGVDSTIDLTGLNLGTKQYKWYNLYKAGDGTTTPTVYDVTTTADAIAAAAYASNTLKVLEIIGGM